MPFVSLCPVCRSPVQWVKEDGKIHHEDRYCKLCKARHTHWLVKGKKYVCHANRGFLHGGQDG